MRKLKSTLVKVDIHNLQNYSMIFKTFDNDIDKISAKWGIFGKSFNDIGTAITSKISDINKNFQATDDLIGSIKNSGDSIWSRLYPSKEDIQSQFVDVMPEINVNNIVDATEKIKTLSKDVANGTTTWQELFDTLPEGQKHIAQLGQQMEGQIITTEGVAKANQKARSSALAHNEALKQQTLGAKAATVAMKALNIVANMAVTWLISEGIQFVVKQFDEWILTIDEAKENIEELTSSIGEIDNSFKSVEKTVSDSGRRFAELSQKVNQFTGANETLNPDEYQEFLDLSNQLADLFPTLSRTYDENGNAIVQLSGDVDTIVGSLNNLVDAERKLANQEIAEKLPDLYESAQKLSSDYSTRLSLATSELEHYQNLLENISSIDIKDIEFKTNAFDNKEINATPEMLTEYAKIFREAGIDGWYSAGLDSSGLFHNIIIDDEEAFFKDLKESELEISQAIDKYVGNYQTKINDASAEISSIKTDQNLTFSNLQHSLIAWVSNNETYSLMSDEVQAGIQNMLSSLNYSELLETYGSYEDLQKYILNSIVEPLKDNKELQDAYIDFFSLSSGDLDRIDAAKVLQDYFDNHNIDIKVMPMVEDEMAVRESLENSFQQIALGGSVRDQSDIREAQESADYKYLQNYLETSDLEDHVDVWLEVYDATKSAQENIEAYEKQLKVINQAKIELPSITETVNDINTKLKPSLDELAKIYQDVFGDDIFTPKNIDISSLASIKEGLNEIGVATEEYENFVKVLTDTESSADDVHKAFNALATDIVGSLNPSLSNCSAENYQLVQSMLESLGIANAQAIMVSTLGYSYEEYLAAKEAATNAGINLEKATFADIENLVTEKTIVGEDAQALLDYYFSKALASGTEIDTTATITELINEYEQLGLNCDRLREYRSLMARDKEGGTFGLGAGNYVPVGYSNQEETVDVTFIPKADVDTHSGSSSTAAETDYAALLEKETSLLEKQLDANLITFRDYLAKRKSLLDDYYTAGKITAEEYYDGLSSLYESQLSIYDKVIGAVTNRIDKEINSLEKQKEVIEESYRFKIDAVQAEIDALNKENEARKEQIALEQAQYEAERARNQRSIKQFVNGQFVYTADMDEVKSAEENLAEQEQQMEISRLEDRIASLEQEMENATASLDNQISALEAYKEQWSEISSVYEEQQNALITAEILGADWETQVLNGRLEALQKFTTQYIALQQAQANAAALSAKIGLDAKAGISTLGSVGTTPAIEYLSSKALKDIPVYHNGLKGGYVGAPEKTDDKLKLLLAAAEDHLTPAVPALLQQGELVLTASQQDNLTAALMCHSVDYGSLALGSYASGGFDFSKLPGTTQSVVQNINLTLPNITNQTGYENQFIFIQKKWLYTSPKRATVKPFFVYKNIHKR